MARDRTAEARKLIDASLAQFGYPAADLAPGLAAALIAASRIYLKSGNPDQAELFAADGLRIAERTAREPRESADVGEAMLVVAQARRAKGDLARSAAPLERAVEALSGGLGLDHRLTKEAVELRRATT